MNNKPDTTNNIKEGIENISGVSSVCSNTDKPVPDTKVKKDRPQNKNLISLADRTPEERREIGRKGGIKSGETKRNRKTMRETIIEMLAETITDDMIQEYGLEKVMKKQGTKTYMDAIMSACLLNAMNGDSKSIQLLRDTAGEQPTIRTENHTELVTAEDLKTMDNLRKYLTG